MSIFIVQMIHSQQKLPNKVEKFPSYFGLQIKPLIPGNFLGRSTTNVEYNGFSAKFTQKTGYSFGGSVRIGVTKLLNIETGIHFVQRYYNVDFSLPDSNLTAKNDFGIVSYDIPLNLLTYIQITDRFFMNASLGGSFIYNPTDVATKVSLTGGHIFLQEGRRFSRFAFETSANFGVEYRTEKSGIFYLGASARIPIKPIFQVAAVYQNEGYKSVAIGNINGAYLALDIRYYFPNIKRKGTQFMPGPIEQ